MKPKRALAIVWCVIFLVWPAMHFVLTRAFDSDPWELFGMAMYTKPKRNVSYGYLVDRGRGYVVVPVQKLPEEFVTRLSKFEKYRKTLGDMQSSDDVAQMFFDRYPECTAVQVHTAHYEVSKETGHLVVRKVIEEYPREGQGNRMVVIDDGSQPAVADAGDGKPPAQPPSPQKEELPGPPPESSELINK